MKIGPYEIFTVNSGIFSLDGGAMFGVVPKVLWNKTNPADELNRIQLALRTLVIKGDGRIILIDAGVGNKMNEKLRKIYNIDSQQNDLERGLAEKGIAPEQVTDVIITHLHFDHVGGATRLDNGLLKPTFPNARYYVQGEQWYWANNPSEKDRASYMPENFKPIEEAGLLVELNGPGEVLPGIETLVMYGHTHGMQLPKISDGKSTLLYCADLIPTASHIPLPYIMAYDNNPLITLEEKKRLLPQAVREKWILVFEHDPFRPAGTVIETEKGFKLGEEIFL
ncbi:MBL fold metallo-hydrolase [Caldithrix abyssi]|uniref:Beta-lactamase domain-containing protein n=1 Tax=Caldithrix abyssi DSM 13497 TaxID=880073 RepID=H1XUK3_CALAY|nr:MBL fold metallo-hydrolase [Caldithrix abyssi]APF16842.1 Glyoxylase, beta-lactamase superfamily II [Caldithrix abyssi DSM 13497]EHO40502.1 beta-lactamase domain-containing protein [Caldithrix abyssi DSM 13497]